MSASNMNHVITRDSSGKVVHKTMSLKEPGPGEIAIRPLYAGVCGTDLQIIRGLRSDPSTILGHEGTAEVCKVGSAIADFTVGQRVTFNPTNEHNPHDILGHTIPGIWQHHMIVSQGSLRRGMLVPLNPEVPFLMAPLIEPLAVNIYADQLIQQQCKPERIVIIGGGTIGLLQILYARMKGYTDITLVSSTQERLAWAIERNIISLDKVMLATADFPMSIQERIPGGVDACYICTTRPTAVTALRQAIELVRPGGCIDLIGGFADQCTIPELPDASPGAIRQLNTCGQPQPGIMTSYKTTQGKWLWLTGHRGVSSTHLEMAMGLLARHTNYYRAVISHILSLPTAARALETLRTTQQRQFQRRECVKMVIDCTELHEYMELL
ncbi:MAG: alcohol dehydrogenase catalytic domain-containing protein [Ktedonobacteraceae bacterium]